MCAHKKNYYGSLCTELYEILHREAPEDELNFYLSYAEKGKKILEPLCGSGRFLVPFLHKKGQSLVQTAKSAQKQQAAHNSVQTCCFSFPPLFKIP